MRNVIRGNGAAPRTPVVMRFWTHEYEFANSQAVLDIISPYPDDVTIVSAHIPVLFRDDEHPYSWVPYAAPENLDQLGLDAVVAIDDWSKLDEVIERFPDPNYSGVFPHIPADDGRYRLLHFWYGLFERHWQLRGMTNALTDYYEYPDEVHRLFRVLTDYYVTLIKRGKAECGCDGFFMSDDLGTQTGCFFSPAIFDEFFAPYYKEICDATHACDMDQWLHACGCIDAFIPKLIDLGFDVLHPIQKYTMDERDIVAKYGGQICFWAGFDVQRIIPYGTPDEVRAEVQFMKEVYARPDGRFIFAAGNGINGDCPLDSLRALYDEAYRS